MDGRTDRHTDLCRALAVEFSSLVNCRRIIESVDYTDFLIIRVISEEFFLVISFPNLPSPGSHKFFPNYKFITPGLFFDS